MELWEALSKRRKEIGMPFSDLEKKTGMPISTLKKIFGGHIAAPGYLNVRSIVYAMKMTIAEFDRMIEENQAEDNGPSAEAMQIANIYDHLLPGGKELIKTTVAFAEKHFKKI